MAQIILDFGSGNTCRNDLGYIKRMIDALAEIDHHKHEVIIKWQLFNAELPSGGGSIIGNDIVLQHHSFEYAYGYAKDRGYKTTSSVFDKESLAFLLGYEVPFIKIACRPELYWLIGEVPRRVEVYASAAEGWATYTTKDERPISADVSLTCVRQYPARLEDYSIGDTWYSDHTEGLALWKREAGNIDIWEKHFVLERDPSNPDAGPFSCIPDQLAEIL